MDAATQFHIPEVRTVGSFDELVSTQFSNGVNALCWPRSLEGDFQQIAALLTVEPGINRLNEAMLRSLPADDAGRRAIDVMLEDFHQLAELGLAPELNCVEGAAPEKNPDPLPTHVYSFHADSATDEADTWLCTYLGASTEGLRNAEAQRRIDIPETRAQLLRIFGGEDDEEFREWLNDHYHDLHYLPLASATPFSFGVGNLWRVALDYAESPVLPCIHRAPRTYPGDPRRLLLIS